MAKKLSRDAILSIDDIQTEEVFVPEWGGSVLVRGMVGHERDAFEATLLKQRGKQQEMDLTDVRAKLAARSIVDEAGALVFTLEDVAALSKKSGAALQRIFNVAQRLSGLSDDDIEELAKNFVSDLKEDSTSS